MLKRALLLACAALVVAGSAQAALQDRDLDGDTVVDAYYDTDLDITWLRDTVGYLTWSDALAWADALNFGGHTDWRLPVGDTCSGFDCTGSEMGHLFYVELGNSAGAMTNPGGFNWTFYTADFTVYWTSTLGPTPGHATTFLIPSGFQAQRVMFSIDMAMAVHDGDLAPVPEPETYALMLAGLAGLALATRRQRGR
jgi:hypothetical protein